MDVIVASSLAYVNSSKVLSDPLIRSKVKIIPLGIDESTYSKRGDSLIFDRLGISNNEPYFLFLGVLRYYKGLNNLINSAKLINVRIVIAGGGKADDLKKKVKELGLNNVVFAGQVTHAEKMALLDSCLALVLPSSHRSEAFGMVLLEASMMGKPMITCEVGTGTSHVNLSGITGLVVPKDNPILLADAMQTLLVEDNLKLQMGMEARSRYEVHFSGPALGLAYNNLYRSLI
jgi:rhamnosyl/mannosyltransferase